MNQLIKERKTELRKRIKLLKKNYSTASLKEKSHAVIANLEAMPLFINANSIMIFWSMDDEVFTHDFIIRNYEFKKIYLPSINGDYLEIKEFKGINNLIENSNFGIPEPEGNTLSNINEIDIIFVPGVAFDRNLNRIGRGKAFYDKLLSNFKNPKIAICFDFQIVDSIPIESNDIKMDMIIAESEIIK